MTLKAKTSRRHHEQKEIALVEATKEETNRLNADVPVSLYKRLKMQAIEEECTITKLVIKSLNEYLDKNSKK